jgi:hypothetical protein
MGRGMSGDAAGINGWLRRGRWRMPYAVAFGLLALACVVNVFSVVHETHGRLAVWRPVVWEASSLAGVLADLAPAGFVRVHRSWIVNGRHVRGALPDGSGDYTLALADGAQIPLSRRFPEALRQLRDKLPFPAT